MTDTTIRNTDLRHMLSTRRREMQVADFYEEMELVLLQMRSDMLTRVDEALVRLDAGVYGSCSECGGEISERRLRALPFAVRCQACEEKREQVLEHTRHAAQLHDDFALVPEMAGL